MGSRKRKPTLKSVKAKMQRLGPDSLTADEFNLLKQANIFKRNLGGGDRGEEKLPPPPDEDWKTGLHGVMSSVVQAYTQEVRKGKGISRITAADRLRDLYKENAAGDGETFDVAFCEITSHDGQHVTANAEDEMIAGEIKDLRDQ